MMPWDLSRLTIFQFVCMGNETSPNSGKLSSEGDFRTYIEQQARLEADWNAR